MVEEITVAPVVTFRFVAGVQAKVVPGAEEEAVSDAVPVPQINPEFTVTTGVGFTVMVMASVSTLPALSMTV